MADAHNITIKGIDLVDDINAKLDIVHAMLDAARVAQGNDGDGSYELCGGATIPDLLYHAMGLTREIKGKVGALWDTRHTDASPAAIEQA